MSKNTDELFGWKAGDKILKKVSKLTEKELQKMIGLKSGKEPATIKDQLWFYALKLKIEKLELVKYFSEDLLEFKKSIEKNTLTQSDIEGICGVLYKYFFEDFVLFVNGQAYRRSSNRKDPSIRYV